MNLQQQIAAVKQLFESISESEREAILKREAMAALQRGDIKRRPDWMMGAEWDAKEKIADLQNKAKKKKPGRHDN